MLLTTINRWLVGCVFDLVLELTRFREIPDRVYPFFAIAQNKSYPLLRENDSGTPVNAYSVLLLAFNFFWSFFC